MDPEERPLHPIERDDRVDGRDETPNERADRNWDELLQELRVMQTGTQILTGFLLAVALNQKLRGSTIYRALFFIPAILSPVVVGIVWQSILDPFSGVLAQFGRATGLTFLSGDYLTNPDTAIFTVIFVNVWMWTGFSMLFYLAGLQLVDTSVLEAAKIDGANGFPTTVRITFPLLKSTHLSLLLLGIIGSLKTFELVYVLTQGGPAHASEMLPTTLMVRQT